MDNFMPNACNAPSTFIVSDVAAMAGPAQVNLKPMAPSCRLASATSSSMSFAISSSAVKDSGKIVIVTREMARTAPHMTSLETITFVSLSSSPAVLAPPPPLKASTDHDSAVVPGGKPHGTSPASDPLPAVNSSRPLLFFHEVTAAPATRIVQLSPQGCVICTAGTPAVGHIETDTFPNPLARPPTPRCRGGDLDLVLALPLPKPMLPLRRIGRHSLPHAC
mmetsp:Transcript_43197/g.99592  ORF Transcript_43197/g.99592 Transcript_43197/m.99592 type:complete len:221 (+) Transcript_43197:147-809(+)